MKGVAGRRGMAYVVIIRGGCVLLLPISKFPPISYLFVLRAQAGVLRSYNSILTKSPVFPTLI